MLRALNVGNIFIASIHYLGRVYMYNNVKEFFLHSTKVYEIFATVVGSFSAIACGVISLYFAPTPPSNSPLFLSSQTASDALGFLTLATAGGFIGAVVGVGVAAGYRNIIRLVCKNK